MSLEAANFLLGAFYLLGGLTLINLADPDGVHDDLVTGLNPSWAHLWLALLLWPVTLLAMLWRR